MNELANFFKRSNASLDNPSHHLVAVFPNVGSARRTADRLRMAGVPSEEVIAAGSTEIMEAEAEGTGTATLLVQALSRFFATEQKYVDHDIELTHRGAGFLAVHCPTERKKDEAWKIIGPEHPLDARYYATSGIEHLAGDPRTD